MRGRSDGVDRAAEVDDFTQWFDATSASVYGIVLAVVRDKHQAAAITQQIYVDLWGDHLRHDVGSISTVAALAHHRAVAHMRRVSCLTGPGPAWVRPASG